MNKQELIQLVVRIQNGDGTEEEIDRLVLLFKNSVLDPNAVDYIFQKEYENLSPEEVVEKALAYRSIQS